VQFAHQFIVGCGPAAPGFNRLGRFGPHRAAPPARSAEARKFATIQFIDSTKSEAPK
jgi:hypothetical protein